MEKSVKRRIMLTGRLKGSALITETGGASAVALSLRGIPDGSVLFSFAKGGIRKTPLTGGTAEIEGTGVCALVLMKDGRKLAEGFSGECAGKRSRILEEIGIMAAGETVKPAQPKPEVAQTEKNPDKPEKKGALKPDSAVTEGILMKAQALFSALNSASAPAASPEPEGTVIPNPFPRTLPGSKWRVKEGDHRLFGERTVNGETKRFIAVPLDMRRRGALSTARAVVSKDGRRFLIEQII